MVDAQVLRMKTARSDAYTHTGNSWNQSDIDYDYHKYDPDRYPNPFANRNPQEDGSERQPFQLNQMSDEEDQTQTFTSGSAQGFTVSGTNTGYGKGFGDQVKAMARKERIAAKARVWQNRLSRRKKHSSHAEQSEEHPEQRLRFFINFHMTEY